MKQDTSANFTTANPVLRRGEIGYETDTGVMKIGDGTTGWASLPVGGSGTVPSKLANQLYYRQQAPAFQRGMFRTFRAALANVMSGVAGSRVKIACIGDSNTAGLMTDAGSTPLRYRSWPSALSSMFDAYGIPSTWDGSLFNNNNITVATYHDVPAGYDGLAAPVTLFSPASPWTGGGVTSISGLAWHHVGSGTEALTFAPYSHFDRLTTGFVTDTGGTRAIAELVVDGGAAVEINTAATFGMVHTTTNLSQGAHSFIIRKKAGQASNSALTLVYTDCWSSSVPHVSVWNWGWSGAHIDNIEGGTAAWTSTLFIPTMAPHLTIIMIGTNDMNRASGYSNAATYKTKLTTLATLAQNAGDLLILSPIPEDPTLDPADGGGPITVEVQQTYVTAAREVAEALGCGYIDTTGVYGSYAETQPLGLYGGRLHTSPAGHHALAQEVFRTIMSS